jgi:hypothetical protein
MDENPLEPQDDLDKNYSSRSQPGFIQKQEEIIDILSKNYARDIIELGEFERRVENAHNAGSLEELKALINDLPEGIAKQREEKTGPAFNFKGPSPYEEDDQRVAALFSTRKLQGDWHQGKPVMAFSLFGSVKIDLTELQSPPAKIEINVFSALSEVKIRVPSSFKIENSVLPVLGDVKEKNRARTPVQSKTSVLQVSGVVLLGDLKIEIVD